VLSPDLKTLYEFDPCDLNYPDPVAQFNGPAYRYKNDRDRYRISITNRHYYWDMFEPVTNVYCTGPEVPWNDIPISRSWPMMDVRNWPEKDESVHYCGIIFLTGAYFMENDAFGGISLILDHRDNSVVPAPESVRLNFGIMSVKRAMFPIPFICNRATIFRHRHPRLASCGCPVL
jgi:hypothetical protein